MHKYTLCSVGSSNIGHDSLESSAESDFSTNSRSTWRSYFYFKRTGTFQVDDIIGVHPAHRRDPTSNEFYGTGALRASLDYFVESLTFSVVVWTSQNFSGYYTLDIECENAESYFILLHGFYLLSQEAAVKRTAEANKSMSERCRAKLDMLANMWQTTRSTVTTIYRQLEQEREKLDPIEQLFQSTDTRRIFREEKNSQAQDLQDRSTQNSAPAPRYGLPPAQFLGWKSAGTQIWARLKMAGLEVKCVFSWDLQKVIFNVRCPQWRLEEVAEHMHIKLKNR
jgi:hypothetical protein